MSYGRSHTSAVLSISVRLPLPNKQMLIVSTGGLITQAYENAYEKEPAREDLAMGVFQSYAREMRFTDQRTVRQTKATLLLT